MADWDDVRRMAGELPETTEREGGHDHTAQWQVKGKSFGWERPLRKADLAALGNATPDGPVLAAWVEDLEAKEALVAEGGAYFTTPHFDGYAIVLIRLDEIALDELAEVLIDAWLCRAPAKLRTAYP